MEETKARKASPPQARSKLQYQDVGLLHIRLLQLPMLAIDGDDNGMTWWVLFFLLHPRHNTDPKACVIKSPSLRQILFPPIRNTVKRQFGKHSKMIPMLSRLTHYAPPAMHLQCYAYCRCSQSQTKSNQPASGEKSLQEAQRSRRIGA